MTTRRLARWIALCALTACSLQSSVIINEVHYHPGSDNDALQFIELHNTSNEAIDLSGWAVRGPKIKIPDGTKIAANGFLVLARDIDAFRRVAGAEVPAIGNFAGRLKRSGEKLELVNAAGTVVESFKYLDAAPWPMAPDGFGSSLERICATVPADDPANWAPSRRGQGERGEGTPGATNSSAALRLPPAASEVKWPKLVSPGQAILVSARFKTRFTWPGNFGERSL